MILRKLKKWFMVKKKDFDVNELNNDELVELINRLPKWYPSLLCELAVRAGREEEYYNIEDNYCMNEWEAQEFFNSVCDELKTNRIKFMEV